MTDVFARPPAGDDPNWPRASTWLAGELAPGATARGLPTVRLIGVPCSVGSISPSRAWATPPQVRAALSRLSPFDPVSGMDLSAAVVAEDLGDWDVSELPLGPAMDRIHELASGLDRSAALHTFVGGDNAITRPVVTGLLGPDLSRVGLVTLDAHHDVRRLDDGPRNGTPVRGLIEDGLDPNNVVQIGIGRFTNSAQYADWCRQRGITTVTAAQVHSGGIDAAIREALAHLGDRVDVIHVDLDVDVLDVAYAPACPGARPGGLTPDQFLAAATRLGAEPRVSSVDLVEVDAAADHDGRTVMVTAMAVLAVAAGRADFAADA